MQAILGRCVLWLAPSPGVGLTGRQMPEHYCTGWRLPYPEAGTTKDDIHGCGQILSVGFLETRTCAWTTKPADTNMTVSPGRVLQGHQG